MQIADNILLAALRKAEEELKKVRLEKDKADDLLKTLEGQQLVLEERMEVEEGSGTQGSGSAGAPVNDGPGNMPEGEHIEDNAHQDVIMHDEQGGGSVVQQENGPSVGVSIEPDIDARKQLIPVGCDVNMADAKRAGEGEDDEMQLITDEQKNQLLGSAPNGNKIEDHESDEEEEEEEEPEDEDEEKKEDSVGKKKASKCRKKLPLQLFGLRKLSR